MSKRHRFVIATLVLLAGIILSRAGLGTFLQWRFRVVIFSLVALLVSIWAVKDEDFNGIEWLVLPILPVMFAIGSLMVFPLLPVSVGDGGDSSLLLGTALKVIFLTIFVVGYYATLLTANIYNVAAIRTIQLLRVAHSIGFLMTVLTGLLAFIVISSLHLSSFWNLLAVTSVSLPLALQAIWSINLERTISIPTRNMTLLTAVILGETAWVLSFWPVGVSINALFLTAIFYELIGIIQFHFGERLNRRIISEFVVVAIVVFLLTFWTTQWGN